MLIEPGEGYAALANGHYQVPVEDPQAWEQLLAEAVPEEPPLRGVVHLWSVDAADTEATTPETLAQDTHLSCGSVLSLVQALVRKDRLPRSGLWLVSRGAEVTQQEHAGSLAQSPLWGMGKVIALEHPELACRLVDLDASDPQDQLDQLLGELLAPDPEDQVALRGNRRFVPRLIRSRQVNDRLTRPAKGDYRLSQAHAAFRYMQQARQTGKIVLDVSPSVLSLRSEGTYLITGGLGGVGLEIARWLV